MASRPREKVAAAFRKLFRSPEKIENDGAGPSGSPARRGLLRRHRDGVSPAEAAASQPASPAASSFVKKKAANEARERAAAVRTRRLMKELKEIERIQNSRPDPVFTVELVNDNLYEWHVRLHQIDPESELATDLRELHIPNILLHLVFPENFPFAPPFMRVIEPRIEKGFVMEGLLELVNDNLYEWHVRLHQIDPESELATDLRELHIPNILLHLVFPENFPFAPPFMRVIEPRIEKGFVMEGGAICMELLTPRGWASAYTVEAVVMQFAASVVKGQGRVARAPARPCCEFSRRRAEEAFRSVVKTHDKYGWVTPSLSDG